MTEKNPDDSVREEQFGADEDAAGTENAIQAEDTQETDSLPEPEKPNGDMQKVNGNEEHKTERSPRKRAEKKVSEKEELLCRWNTYVCSKMGIR